MSLPDDPVVVLVVALEDVRPPYCDAAELATLLGVPADSPRVLRAVDATTAVIDSYYGAATVVSRLPAPPWPAAVVEAALQIGQDIYRRLSTPGGVFVVSDFVGRLPLDPTTPVMYLLDSVHRETWPVA